MYIYLLKPANYPECVYKIGMSAKESTQRLASYRGQARVIVVLGVNCSSEKECKTLEAQIISNLESKYTLYSGKEYFIIPAEDEREVINMMFDIIGEHNRKNPKPSHELCSPCDTLVKSISADKLEDPSGFTYSVNRDGLVVNDQSGYINATKLLKSMGLNKIKHPNDWLRLDKTEKLITHIITTSRTPSVCKDGNTYAVFSVNSGPLIYQGMYIHPDLVRNIVEWIDPISTY
jgi:hypothetical protein